MNLKQKTIENTFIVFAVTFFNRGLNVLTRVILARLLFPEDFGLVAIASIIINAVSLFREMGVESAIIYRKSRVEEASHTAFIMIPVIASGLYAIVYLIAPYAGDFYNEVEVSSIIRVSGITLLLSSLTSVPITLFAKELNFRKRMIPEVVSNLVYTLLTILLALNGFRVWSLVYGGLISGFIGFVTVWAITPYRPKFVFDTTLAKEMIGYGKYVLGAQIVIFVLTNVDNAVVGKMLDMKALGYYAMAYSIASMPATNITHIVGKILFPTYSILQDNREKLGRMFIMVVKYVSFLTVPVSFCLFALAPELVTYILGEKWIPVIPALRILCLYGLLRSLNATTGDLFNATGNPKYLRDISLIQLFVVAVLIVPAVKFGGIEGVAALIVLKGVIATILSFKKALLDTRIEVRAFIGMMIPFILSAMIATVVILMINQIYESSIQRFIVDISLFGITYTALVFTLDKRLLLEMREVLSGIRSV